MTTPDHGSRLRDLALRLQEAEHERIVRHVQVRLASDPYQHGSHWPGKISNAFEDCDHPDCVLVRASASAPPENVLSSPMAAGLLLTLKAECEAQHARAEKAEAELAALRASVGPQEGRMVLTEQDGRWRFTDECGHVWRLTETGDEDMPLLIEAWARRGLRPSLKARKASHERLASD